MGFTAVPPKGGITSIESVLGATSDDVSTTSVDYDTMSPYWEQVTAVLGGVKAMRQTPKYLVQYPGEETKDYEYRLATAEMTNVFRDITENLASKPFSKTLEFSNMADDKAALPDSFEALEKNVDGHNTHLHVFGADVFFRGLAYGLHWVFVDMPPKQNDSISSVSQEKEGNLSPYWVSLSALDVISAITEKVGSKHRWKNIRYRADSIENEGYKQVLKERIREYSLESNEAGNSRVVYLVWEKQIKTNSNESEWVIIEEGVFSENMDEIPIVPFLTGRKIKGMTFNPMLQDAADLQINLYRQENGLKNVKENTSFPMLVGNGVNMDDYTNGSKRAEIRVGPKGMLTTPMNGDGDFGEWSWIEPAAENAKFLASEIQETIRQLRELGRQPLTAQTGNLTVVTTAVAAEKGNSAVQAAALQFKDSIDNALRLTSKWLGVDDDIEVVIHTDFDTGQDDGASTNTLITSRAKGDLSQLTYWDELGRRNILGPNFDSEKEAKRLEEESPDEPNIPAKDKEVPKSNDNVVKFGSDNAARQLINGVTNGN